jgi:(S)-2-hydroxyglutarate dehydrogenase
MEQSDLIIIGGGIVGLATAYRFLERFPGKRITVLEKEATVASHQTGRNSGVLHSGIYYRPGSLKAENCRAGKLAMEEFCREQSIPFNLCGKIIVAVDDEELARMEKLLERGKANGVECERIGPERIRELAPHATGLAAIYVPEAGIVDYAEVARRLATIVEEQGSRIVTSAKATGVRRDANRAIVETTAGEFAAE